MRRPFLSRVALPALTWGLPFHIILMAGLFGGLGVSEGIVRALAAWKEVAVLSLVLVAVGRAIASGKPKMEISIPDLCVVSLFATALCYLIFDKLVFGGTVSGTAALFGAEAPSKAALLSVDEHASQPGLFGSFSGFFPGKTAFYGLRDATFFMLLYFVGRATPEVGDTDKALRRLYLLGLVTSIFAIAEMVFVTPDMLVYLGATSYFQDFLGVSAFTQGNEYGLPTSYWSRLGNHDVRRAGSIYLSGQGFAVPFLLLMPAATAWVFGRVKAPDWRIITGYAVIWTGLLLTLTRMTIIVCAIQLFVYILWQRKPQWAVAGGVAGALVIVAASFVVPSLLSFVWQTLTWQTGSSTTHLSDWSRGLEAFGMRPWGWGLGTTDLTAVRSGLDPLTADNQYLKYGVEMGVLGLLGHLAVLATIMGCGFKVATISRLRSRKLLGQTIAIATIGIMLNAMTAVVFNAMVLSYLYFWIAGSVVSIWQLERGRYRVPAGRTSPNYA